MSGSGGHRHGFLKPNDMSIKNMAQTLNLLPRADLGRKFIRGERERVESHVRGDLRAQVPSTDRPSFQVPGWFAGEPRLTQPKFGFNVKQPNYLGQTDALQPLMRTPLSSEVFVTQNDPRFRRQNVLLEVQINGSYYGGTGEASEVMSAVSGRVLCFAVNTNFMDYLSPYMPLTATRPAPGGFKCFMNLFRVNYQLRQITTSASKQLEHHTAAAILTSLVPYGVLDQVQNSAASSRSYIPAMTGSILRRGPVYFTGTDSGLINIWAPPPAQGGQRQPRPEPGSSANMLRQGLDSSQDLAPSLGRHLWLVLEPVSYQPDSQVAARVVWRFRPYVTLTDEPLPMTQCTGCLFGKNWSGASVYVGQVLADNDPRNYKGELARSLDEIQSLLYGRFGDNGAEPPHDLRRLPSLSHVHIQPYVTLY